MDIKWQCLLKHYHAMALNYRCSLLNFLFPLPVFIFKAVILTQH